MSEFNEFNELQKVWIRENVNNPFNLGCFIEGEFSDLFNTEITDTKLKQMRKDDEQLYGNVSLNTYKYVNDDRLPRLKLGELYVIEPYLMSNNVMSNERVVYLSDDSVTTVNDVHNFDDRIEYLQRRNYNRCVEQTGKQPVYASELKRIRAQNRKAIILPDGPGMKD